MKLTEDVARKHAHSIGPCDFGSTEAIKVFAQALEAFALSAIKATLEDVANILDCEYHTRTVHKMTAGCHSAKEVRAINPEDIMRKVNYE